MKSQSLGASDIDPAVTPDLTLPFYFMTGGKTCAWTNLIGHRNDMLYTLVLMWEI